MKPKRPLLWLMPIIVIAICPQAGAAISWTTGPTGDLSGDWSSAGFNGQAYSAADDLDINGAVDKTITTAGAITTPLSLTVSNSAATTLTGSSVGGSLSKTNAGVLTLSSPNTFDNVTISGGKFVLNDAAALGTTGTLNVNAGAASGVVGSYGAPGATFFYDSGVASSYTFSKAIAFGAVAANTTYGMAMPLGTSAAPLTTTLSGNVTGEDKVTLWLDVRVTANPSFSTWILSGDNSAFAGNIRLNRGSIQFNSKQSMGGGAVFIQTNGSDALTPVGGVIPPANLTFGFSDTVSNPLTLRTGSGSSFSLDTGANNVILSGPVVISGDSGGSNSSTFLKHGTGTLDLTGSLDTLLRGGAAVTVTSPIPQGAVTSGNVSANLVGGTLKVSGMTGPTLTLNALNGVAGTVLNLGAKPLVVSSGTFAGDLSATGASSLTKNSAGTLTLSGTNTYGGGTTISGGFLQFANAAATPTTGTITINASGSLIASGVHNTVQGWLGDSRLATSSTGSIAITGNTSAPIDFTGFNSLGLSTTGSAICSGTITPGTGGYIFGGDAGTALTITSPLNPASTVTKNGAGTLILAASTNYSGPITFNAGTVALTGSATLTSSTVSIGTGSLSTYSVNAIGAPGSTIKLTNGTTGLIYTGAGETTDRVINYASASSGGTITSNGSGPLVFSAPATTTATAGFGVFFSGRGNGSFVGVTQPATPVLINFNKQGGGTWTLTGLNNLKAGAFRADGGVLNFAATATTGSGANAATITRTTAGAGVLTIASGASVITSTANTSGILGGWATFAGDTWAVTGGNAAAITGLASFTNDTWAAGNNTDVTSAAADPASGSTTHSLRFNAAGAKTLTLAGTNLITSGGILATSGIGASTTLITGGTLTAGAAINTAADLIVHQNNAAGGLTVASVIANNGTGATGLTKVGSGLMTLTSANTYTGATNITGGTLALNVGGGVGTIRGTVTVHSGGTLSGLVADSLGYTEGSQIATLNLNGGTFNNAVLGNQGYTTNVNLTAGTITSTGGGAFNFNGSFGITSNAAAVPSIISSPILIRNATKLAVNVAPGTVPGGVDLNISGVVKSEFATSMLTKTGAGTLQLSGVNTYTGATTVSAGTLQGTGSASSALTVATTATLSPGVGVGTWLSTTATFASGSIFKAEINSTTETADQLKATGAVSLGGATLVLSDLGTKMLANGKKLTLIDYTGGSLTGTFAGLAEGATVTLGWNTFVLSYADSSKVTLTALLVGDYGSWAIDNAGGQAANLDFDNDGVMNGVEYFMGQTGDSFTSNPAVIEGKITWPKDPTAIGSYIVQISSDLVTWNPAPTGVQDTGTAVIYTLPTSGGKLFVRLRVSLP